MRRFSAVAAAWACAVVIGVGAARATAPPIVLENERLRLTFVAEGGARLVALFAKDQGRNLIDADARAPLYEIELRDNGGRTVRLDASRADTTRVDRSRPGTLRFLSRHAARGLEVVSTVTLAGDAGAVTFALEIRRDPRPRDSIVLVRYPGLAAPLADGAGILMPVADGLRITDPARTMADGEARCYDYPGLASAQLLAIYDGTGGLLGYTADGAGNYKRLCARRIGRAGAIYAENVVTHLDGDTIALPYEFVAAPFRGGWTAAADLYKTWAEKQPWCTARREADPRTAPAAAAAPSFFLGVSLRRQHGASESDSEVPAAAGFLKSWRDALALPVTGLLFSWEKHGAWITPDVFPPFGGDDGFKGMTTALHRDGNRAALYLSGLNVTLEKSPRNGAPRYRIPESELTRLKPSAVVGPDGEVQVIGSPQGEGTGAHLVLCPATAEARRLLADNARRALLLGADVVQVDQIVGGGTPPCFSTRHGHPPGGGTTAYTAMAAILDDLRALAGNSRQRAAVSLEEPGELFIPHVDLFHCRDYIEAAWPRDRPGSSGVPLFSYLYHEYVPGYGGDSAPLAARDEDPSVALYAQGANLAAGRLPAAAVWMKNVPYTSLHPALARFVRDTAALWKGEAGPYLLHGRVVPIGPEQPPSRRVRTTLAGRTYTFDVPDLLARGFRLEDGSVGALYVNVGNAPRTVRPGAALPASGPADLLWPPQAGPLRRDGEVTVAGGGILFARVRP